MDDTTLTYLNKMFVKLFERAGTTILLYNKWLHLKKIRVKL